MDVLRNGLSSKLVFENQPVQTYRFRYEIEFKKRIRGGGLKCRNGTTASDVPVVKLKCDSFVDQVKFKCILYTPDHKYPHYHRLHDGSLLVRETGTMEFDGLRYPEENCWRCQLRNIHIMSRGRKEFYKWFNENYFCCPERQITKISKFQYAELKRLQAIIESIACLRVQAFCGNTLLGTAFSELIFNQGPSKKFDVIEVSREFGYFNTDGQAFNTKMPNRNERRKRLKVQPLSNSLQLGGYESNSTYEAPSSTVSSVEDQPSSFIQESSVIDTSEVSTSQPRTRSTYAMWTEDRIRHLIRLYEDHPLLWNNQLSAVSGNQDLRENAISDIAHTLRLDSRDIKKKITSLRDYFIKECQTLERSNDVEQPKSKWIFFDNLAFLKDFLPQLNSRPNLSHEHTKPSPQWQIDEVPNEDQEVIESPWPDVHEDSITIEYSSNVSSPELCVDEPTCMMVEMNDAQAEAKRDHEEDSDNDISDRNSRVSPYFRNHKKFQQRTGEMQFFCDYLGSQLTSIKKASTRRRLERDILGMVHKALDSEEGILVFDNE